MKERILSGMRPTGKLHLGHLAGALENWTRLQQDYDCYFMVADWHALMSEYEDPSLLKEYIIDNVIDWLSVGIDPQKSTIFIQSTVPQHLELMMVFACFTPLGWLERCPTYKEQLRQLTTRDLHTYAFLGYPVLQAADILVYKAQRVPVGEDQLPHLELTRQIARRFNSLYHCSVFPDPEPLLTSTPRLLGLDGRKMSKSYNNTISLSDSLEVIAKKISSMVTDPKRIHRTDKGHPDVCSVFSYYLTFFPEKKEEIAHDCRSATLGCTDCKKKLAHLLAERLAPISERRRKLMGERDKVKDILAQGSKKALLVAQATLDDTRRAMRL